MIVFAVFATLLIVAVAAFLLPPLWLGVRRSGHADRKAANLAIFRDQLAELEREKAEGTLSEADFQQARSELQRRLLEEVEAPEAGESGASGQPSATRKTALALVVLIPVLALGGYALLGKPQALDPAQTRAQPKMSPQEIAAMVDRLAAKLKENPDNPQGWLMLARSYKAMGRYEDAADAYGKAGSIVDQDPELLASYAETLAMASGQGLKGKPRALIDKALKLDPNHAHTLFLAGAAAMEAGENKQGIAYWEALLPQVEAGSEIDRLLRDGIEKMKQAK